jgi:DeoR/GlpR family transcriptional regulator of sugar metabolism
MRLPARTGDVLDAGEHRQSALAGDRHVPVGSGGLAGQPQDGVAVLEQPLRGRVHDLSGERPVEAGVAGPAQHRQRDPFADHRDVAGAEDRPRRALEPREVARQERRIVVLPAQRRDLLLSRLRSDGQIVAKDLAEELGISEDSLRRDLREMAAAGLCQRVYGGALPVSPAIGDYAARQAVATDSKQRVARRAAGLIAPGSTAILDGGTTALQVARALPPELEATIVTHSPTVVAELIDHPRVALYLIGGRVFKHSAVTSGAAAAEAAGAVNADLFLLGVTGVHPKAGLTTGDGDEAAMKRALARRAADTYVLASSEKIGAASQFSVLPLADVAGVITDADPDHATLRELERAGVAIVSA